MHLGCDSSWSIYKVHIRLILIFRSIFGYLPNFTHLRDEVPYQLLHRSSFIALLGKVKRWPSWKLLKSLISILCRVLRLVKPWCEIRLRIMNKNSNSGNTKNDSSNTKKSINSNNREFAD